MFLYVVMAVWSAAALGFNTRLSAMMAQAIAPTGALMTFIALWTGALWGRPTWGTYWAWDARMTSELILLFLYLGVIALRNAIDDPRRADRACALLSLTGVVNMPIIYFSVHWWNTLHQGSSVSLTGRRRWRRRCSTGMLIMTFAAWFYAIAVIARARARDHPRARARRRAGSATLREVEARMSEFFAMNGVRLLSSGRVRRDARSRSPSSCYALRARRRAALAEARLARPEDPRRCTGAADEAAPSPLSPGSAPAWRCSPSRSRSC